MLDYWIEEGSEGHGYVIADLYRHVHVLFLCRRSAGTGPCAKTEEEIRPDSHHIVGHGQGHQQARQTPLC